MKDYETILAFDPGTATVGWAALHTRGDRKKLGQCGVLKTPKTESPEKRLKRIYEQAQELIEKWEPDVVAVERLFFAKNQTTAIRVGQAVGVVMLAAAQKKLEVVEYTPPEVKMAVVGEGNAEKQQVQYMVTRILGLDEVPKPDDAADAVAVAICHANARHLRAVSRQFLENSGGSDKRKQNGHTTT